MLESLDVSSNNLELIPVGIASMRSLKELILSDNQLKEIPDGEYQITALSICVTKCLSSVDLWQSNSLQTLDASRNMMESISPSIVHSRSL